MRRGHKTKQKQIGNWGEACAANWLTSQGYRIIAKNVFLRHGELDIIAWHNKPHFGETLCFIEVKTRTKADGSAEYAVNHTKQQKIMVAAKQYCCMKQISLETTPIQCEQISIYGTSSMYSINQYVLPME